MGDHLQSAQLGVTTVLHTWARDLHFHPHAHCIVTGGGLAPDGKIWVAARPDFLLPVHVLGALFRGKFLAGLERLRAGGLLADELDDRAARRRRARLYDQSWVVYAKRPFGGAEQVYRYLGRYTHCVAIGNSRLVSVDDHAVVFRTRGQDTATLSPVEFIRRFLDNPTTACQAASSRSVTAASSRPPTSTAASPPPRPLSQGVPRLSRPRRRARPAHDGVPRPAGRSGWPIDRCNRQAPSEHLRAAAQGIVMPRIGAPTSRRPSTACHLRSGLARARWTSPLPLIAFIAAPSWRLSSLIFP